MICQTYIHFFKTLADPSQLEIIKALRAGNRNVSQLSQELGFEQSRVSHNLRKLKEQGFVVQTTQGKNRIYSLEPATIIPLLSIIDKHVDTYYKHYCKCKGKAKKERWNKVTA